MFAVEESTGSPRASARSWARAARKPAASRSSATRSHIRGRSAQRTPPATSHSRTRGVTTSAAPAGTYAPAGADAPASARRKVHHVPRDGARGAPAKDQALQQRVAGEPIGAVDAGAGHLAHRVEARHRRARPGIHRHATHEIVRRGGDRDAVAGEIQAVARTDGGDGGEALARTRSAGRWRRSRKALGAFQLASRSGWRARPHRAGPARHSDGSAA